MKKAFLLPSVLLFSIAIYAQRKPAKKIKIAAAKGTVTPVADALKTSNDSVSYAFGISIGNYMKSQDVKSINYKLLNQAIETSLQGKTPLMDGNQANQCISKLAQARMEQTSSGEKMKGKKFLEENKKRAGVMTTASGLQYEILKKGDGPMPKATDTVTAHYAGSLISGKEFDNSYKRGEPLNIPVSGVIRGWTEALQLMPVGSKWKLFIPAELGYGDGGAGQDIPGGATLVFEVELLGIGGKK